MSDENLNKLWTTVGTVTCLYALNAWLLSQGANTLFSVALLDDRAVPGSYLAVFIVSAALAIVTYVGRRFLVAKSSLHWTKRFPTVALKSLNPTDGFTKGYQSFFLMAFFVLPLAAIIHFNHKVMRHGDVADKLEDTVYPHRLFYIPSLGNILKTNNYGNRYCMGQDLKQPEPCKRSTINQGGITWFPLVSPIFMIGVSLVSALYTLDYLAILFLRRRIWGKKA